MSTIEEVGARLESLERSNRRLRGAAAVLLAGFVALAAVALPGRGRGNRTIEAQRLVIRDNEGRVRGSFGVDHAGLPGLKILDHRGLEQIDIGIQSDDSATLTFSDRGSPRVMMETSIEGAASLRFFDRMQMLQAALVIKPDGAAELSMGQGARTVNLAFPPVAAAVPGRARDTSEHSRPVATASNSTTSDLGPAGEWIDEGVAVRPPFAPTEAEADSPGAVGGMGY